MKSSAIWPLVPETVNATYKISYGSSLPASQRKSQVPDLYLTSHFLSGLKVLPMLNGNNYVKDLLRGMVVKDKGRGSRRSYLTFKIY